MVTDATPSLPTRSRRNHFAIGAALILLCFYALILGFSARRQAGNASVLPAGSSASASPNGSLAVAQVWRQLRLPFTAWGEPPDLLPRYTKDTFVSVDPSTASYPPEAATALLDWARTGHTIIFSAAGPTSVSRSLHLTVKARRQIVITSIRESSRRARPVTFRHLSLPVASVLSGIGLNDASRLFIAETGAVVGAQFRVGDGNVVVWNAPAVFENRDIGKAQNFRIVWSLVGNHPLMWDEYGHGITSGGFIRQMFQSGRGYSLLFLITAVLLYLYASSLRFGRARRHVEDRARPGTEFMKAFSSHLQSRRLYPYQVELLAAAVWRNLASQPRFQSELPREGVCDHSLPWARMDETMRKAPSFELQSRYQTWRQWHARKRLSKREFLSYVVATRELLTFLLEREDGTQ